MKIQTRRLSALCVTSAVAALTALSGSSVIAAPLDLSDTPLFLSTGVQPNLIMAIDDSGSMDFEVLLRGNDGSAWWRTANDSGLCTAATGSSFIGCVADGATDLPAIGQLNFNNSGIESSTWRKYSYLFPNGGDSDDDSYRRRLGDGTNSHFAIPPLTDFAWARSPDFNSAYFNPANEYEPWPDGGGYTFADSSPTAARFDPVFGDATNAIDLTRDFAGTGSADVTASCANSSLPGVAGNYYFRVQTGMTIAAGACIRRSGGNWEVVRTEGCRVGVNSGCYTREGATDLRYRLDGNTGIAIRYFPATFYLADSASLPSDFGYTGATLAGAAPNGTVLRGYEIKSGNFATTAQYDAAIQNFANWFTYSRKRHQALRAGLGQAFSDITAMRVGGFTINNYTASVTMGSIDDATHRDNLYGDFYRDFVRSGGTPNRPAVYNMVRNFKRTGATAPIQHACQKNFGMLFTDGFSNQPASGDGFYSLGNIDGTYGDPYADNESGTLADGVKDAYVNRLRTTTDFEAGKVRVPAGCGSASPDPKLDCNRDLHMNFYAVTLGTRGLQFDPDAIPAQDPYATTPLWPTDFPARNPAAVDDIWHATVNGRGQLLNARSPDEISDKLSSVLTSIIESSGSASSASVNSGSISSETRVFQAKFDSADWTGQLLSFPVRADGSLDTTGSQVWDASDELPAAADREIITVNSDGSAVAFTWSALDAVRKAAIDPAYTVSAGDEARASARLDYLRGDATNEAIAPYTFRARPSKLGDIIASSPMFVGAPRFGYRDSLESKPYSAFKLAHSDNESTATVEGRRHVVYAGANDGMLHAFDAVNGTELLAFIPSPAFRNLRTLSDPAYSHKYFVDGAPNMGDAFIDNDWRTVLLGGLNKGGQGIYALDVTDPDDFTEANAGSIVMWEFTDANERDLGYTYSQPAIVRLQNGRWGAIFGNGYNNTENDGRASATGNAVLFIVDLQDGSIIRKLDTGVGAADDPEGLNRPNGMSTPAVVDLNGDAKVDFVYAGDLFGNLWKFDIRSTDKDNWDFSFSDSSGPLPLFSARDPVRIGIAQPITSRPEVTRGPRGVGMMVLFGTGKYIETSDKVVDSSDQRIQAYYGLFDRNSFSSGAQDSNNRVTALTELVQQTIIDELSVTFSTPSGDVQRDIRLTSQLPLGGNKGWYLNLQSPDGYQGERQVSNTAVRAGRVIFTTLIPDEDPCESGGSSWLMELDALSGGRLTETPFDLNNDGVFDEGDYVVAPDGTRVPVSGLQPGVGITPEPGILIGDNGRKEFKYNPGTSGAIAVTVENPGKGASGRQSWRQIR